MAASAGIIFHDHDKIVVSMPETGRQPGSRRHMLRIRDDVTVDLFGTLGELQQVAAKITAAVRDACEKAREVAA